MGRRHAYEASRIHPHVRSDDVIFAAVNFAMVLTHVISPPKNCFLMLKQFGDSSRCHLNILSTHYIESEPRRIILVHWLPMDCTTQQGEIEGQKRRYSSIKNGGISLILDST